VEQGIEGGADEEVDQNEEQNQLDGSAPVVSFEPREGVALLPPQVYLRQTILFVASIPMSLVLNILK
jgi:hypothetical protein